MNRPNNDQDDHCGGNDEDDHCRGNNSDEEEIGFMEFITTVVKKPQQTTTIERKSASSSIVDNDDNQQSRNESSGSIIAQPPVQSIRPSAIDTLSNTTKRILSIGSMHNQRKSTLNAFKSRHAIAFHSLDSGVTVDQKKDNDQVSSSSSSLIRNHSDDDYMRMPTVNDDRSLQSVTKRQNNTSSSMPDNIGEERNDSIESNRHNASLHIKNEDITTERNAAGGHKQ